MIVPFSDKRVETDASLTPRPMQARIPLLEIPSPFATAPGRLLLLEPPHANVRKLRTALLDESYPRPFVVDDGELRTLYFNIRLMQSVMRLHNPNSLELRYTRKMMCFLLFNPRPKRIALIGMGGGSLVKYCHYSLPSCHMTAVELDADVLGFRDAFRLPPDGARLDVVHSDGSAYLDSVSQRLDVLLVDAFDSVGVAPGLANRNFFESAFAKLSAKGQLVVNLAGDRKRYKELVARASETFNGQAIVVPVRGDGNAVLFAFKDSAFKPTWRTIHKVARELGHRYGLDFADYARKIERAARL